MSRVFLGFALAAVVAGCTTYKLWTESDADQQLGTVSLSYEYRRFESPQADERGGLETARERCRDWGFKDAHRSSEDRACVDGTKSDCSKWRVTREYRCTKDISR
jgi:YecR-like lipoprotein